MKNRDGKKTFEIKPKFIALLSVENACQSDAQPIYQYESRKPVAFVGQGVLESQKYCGWEVKRQPAECQGTWIDLPILIPYLIINFISRLG